MPIQLSIILPIYNVEPYLEKCIRSLENQDISKDTYEIICVNDGSPDNSKSIVEELQKEFTNIILINQENQGVSVARNNGIREANGFYLFFVDPDDAIEENCLKKLIHYANTNNYDVVYSPLTFVEMDGTKEPTRFNTKIKKSLAGLDLYHAVRGSKINDPDRSYAILYKRDLILKNELFYLKDVPYLEDGEFIARVLCVAKRGSIYNIPYYLRLNRPGSATMSDLYTQMRSIRGFLIASKSLLAFKTSKNLSLQQKEFLNQPICKFTALAVHSCAVKIDFKKFRFVKNELKKNALSKLDVKGCNSEYTKLGNAYNLSLNYFFFYLMIKHAEKFITIKLKR